MTRRFNTKIDMQGNRITGLPTAQSSSEPVTKTTFDSAISELNSDLAVVEADIASKTASVTNLSNSITNRVAESWITPSAYVFSHFVAAGIGEFTLSSTGSGGTTGAIITGTTAGVYRIGRGTVATNRAGLGGSPQSLLLGQSASGSYDLWKSRIALLQTYSLSDYSIIRAGFYNSDVSAITAGVFFLYDLSVASTWQAVCMTPSGTTTVVTTAAIDPGNFHELSIVVDPSGSKARFYYDNTLVATIATNIPKSSGQEVTGGVNLLGVAGTTNHQVSIDHLGFGVQQNIIWS